MGNSRSIRVVFAHPKLGSDLRKLYAGAFEDRRLAGFIDRALDDLAKDPDSGIKIPKKLWPAEYGTAYLTTNLYKYDLPNGWRLIYFIRGTEVEILAIVLESLTHKEYERRFGY